MTLLLLKHGADPNLADKDGDSALHTAAGENSGVVAATSAQSCERIVPRARNVRWSNRGGIYPLSHGVGKDGGAAPEVRRRPRGHQRRRADPVRRGQGGAVRQGRQGA